MNNPEYIVVEVLGEVVEQVRAALGLPVLNYQYGYVRELGETLAQYQASPEYAAKKYPLVWLQQPFTLRRGRDAQVYGEVRDLRVFVINASDPTWKATRRMEQNFKPVLYPLYRELLRQLNSHAAISYDPNREHDVVDRYYWGEEQQQVLSDVVDCLIVQQLTVKLNHNTNCQPNFRSF